MRIWQTEGMKRPHAPDNVRERALAAINEGRSVADVAAFCRNDPSPIRSWIRMRRRNGSWPLLPRSERPRQIGPDQETALRVRGGHLEATVVEHSAWWETAQGLGVGVATMGRVLRHLGVTRKKDPNRPRAGPDSPRRPAGLR